LRHFAIEPRFLDLLPFRRLTDPLDGRDGRITDAVDRGDAGAGRGAVDMAPQSAMPQPNFVPVKPSTSRNTHKRGVSPSTSTE
jgi:hypothetical protein